MKVWALMFYGIDEAECYGVTDSADIAAKWVAADMYHGAREFKMNEIDWPNWVDKDKRF